MKSKDPVFLSSPATLTPAKLTVLPFLTDDRRQVFPKSKSLAGGASPERPFVKIPWVIASLVSQDG